MGRRTQKYPKTRSTGKDKPGLGGNEQQDADKRTVSTLLIPYTIGSKLKEKIQDADDKFVSLLGGGWVRVVERGGTVLAHMLGRSDPWATTRLCDDQR